jgi:hypothetical protein
VGDVPREPLGVGLKIVFVAAIPEGRMWVPQAVGVGRCDLQRSKGVKLIINDDYTHKYIIHVLNQFDQDIHSRQRQTDEQFTYSNCFHRSYSQQVREKESNSHESIQESA